MFVWFWKIYNIVFSFFVCIMLGIIIEEGNFGFTFYLYIFLMFVWVGILLVNFYYEYKRGQIDELKRINKEKENAYRFYNG